MARWLRLCPGDDPSRAIAEGVGVLARGGLVVVPTETLYALAADATNPRAVERLVQVKRRPAASPVAVIIPDWDWLQRLAEPPAPRALELLKGHWPGPLTAVLAARAWVHPALVSADGGVGMRISPHPFTSALVRSLARPITATSANPSGRPAPTRAGELDPGLADEVDLVIDAGPCPGGPPSTVADLRVWPPRVLRQGAVELEK